jgi:hypothetical protein
VVSEKHPFLRQAIKIGGLQLFLPIATEIADPQIVRQDVNHIGAVRAIEAPRKQHQHEEKW